MGGRQDDVVEPLRLTSGNPVLVAVHGISFALESNNFSGVESSHKAA
jgi:hypothetical protein